MGVKIVLGVLLAAALVTTVVGYPKRYGALSGRSRLFRVTGMALVDLILIVALTYVLTPPLNGTSVMAFRHISLVGIGILLSLSLLCIAVLDALESFVLLRREERATLARMAQEAKAGRRSDA